MINKIFAQEPISNPVLPTEEGTYTGSGVTLAPLLVRLWRAIVILGGLALLVFLVWGAIDWLMSEGDQEKLKHARNKITHAIIGMALLALTYAIMKFAEVIFGFNLLNVVWPTPNN